MLYQHLQRVNNQVSDVFCSLPIGLEQEVARPVRPAAQDTRHHIGPDIGTAKHRIDMQGLSTGRVELL